MEANIQEKQVKSIISKSNLPEADFVLNPYIGCGHGCVYCYADFMKKFSGNGEHKDEDWGILLMLK